MRSPAEQSSMGSRSTTGREDEVIGVYPSIVGASNCRAMTDLCVVSDSCNILRVGFSGHEWIHPKEYFPERPFQSPLEMSQRDTSAGELPETLRVTSSAVKGADGNPSDELRSNRIEDPNRYAQHTQDKEFRPIGGNSKKTTRRPITADDPHRMKKIYTIRP